MLIGVISDTHGLMRPEALRALKGSQLIVHAGDVGDPGILDALRTIAPVVAVRGNIDTASSLPEFDRIEQGGRSIYILHDVNQLDFDPSAAGIDAVISGHSHKPSIRTASGVLYLNPGSAGPRRFKLPITIALLRLGGKELEAHHVSIKNVISTRTA
jgi:uncharacterized protein